MSFKRGAYDCVTDIEAYCKRKRKVRIVILADSFFPRKCDKCGKEITVEDGNRTWVYPKEKKIAVFHYECAWGIVFNKIYAIASVI